MAWRAICYAVKSSMSYVVLARKWRPMSFEDLIGQGHVSRTLANAIQSGRVAHAFLFTGVRGVGKTTSARILAKALNCTGTAAAPLSGPTATPCLECPACKEITAGTDIDVREIDGASYNGVDEVRKLQDSLPYRPARDRYKIFIVDEVHMLSQSAWNAFLKTLEEPPPHVKFIFATTEVHKVPVTILSRVQRFDFKLIPTRLIAKRLKHVLDAEGIGSDEHGLSIIAREAAGSMRDAMSLLDQVIAWNDQALDGESVARVLGVASRSVLHELSGALVDGNAATCLDILGRLASQGYDLTSVARDLLAMLRDLVVMKTCEDTADLVDLADEERSDVGALAARTTADDLVRLHQGMSSGFDDVVRSGQVRAALEMLCVRLARRPQLIPIDDLVTRLIALEKRLGAAPRGNAPTPAGVPPVSSGGAQRSQTPERTRASGSNGAHEPSRPPATSLAKEDRPGESSSPPPHGGGEPRTGEGKPAEQSGAPSASDAAGLDAWRSVLERVRAVRPDLAAVLQHGTLVRVDQEQIVVGFEQGSVFERSAKAAESLGVVRQAAREHFGKEPTLKFDTTTPGTTGISVSALDSQARTERQREALARAKDHPRITEAAQILGARLKEIRLPDE